MFAASRWMCVWVLMACACAVGPRGVDVQGPSPASVDALQLLAGAQGAADLHAARGALLASLEGPGGQGEARAALAAASLLLGRIEADPDLWLEARNHGLSCLEAAPGFAARMGGATSELSASALVGLRDADAGCLAMTTEAWARWVHARGVRGVAIDLRPLGLLVGALGDIGTGLPPGKVAHITALVDVLRGDTVAAQGGFAVARRAAPMRRAVLHDQLVWLGVDDGPGAWNQLADPQGPFGPPQGPEDAWVMDDAGRRVASGGPALLK